MRTKINWKSSRIILGIVTVAILYFSWYLVAILLFYYPIGSKLANGVNKSTLISLKPGMTEDEVIAIIGVPLHKTESKWTYGTPGLLGAGWEINLKMDDYGMAGVYVDLSDIGVYRCDTNNCPVIMKADWFERLNHKKI